MSQNHAEHSPLPDYNHPPVVETILGVQFDRLPGFRNIHLGAFWKTLDPEEWPTASDAPPLQPEFERFTESARWAKGVQIQLTQDLAGRARLTDRAGKRMIQVQNGRLHFNWLGQEGEPYPRYQNVRDGFAWALQRFLEFIGREQLGDFHPNQWEVTYLNHIPKGTVWNTPQDWGFFRPLGSVPTIAEVVEGESFSGSWHFVIPGQRGRLHIQWQHGAQSGAEGTEVVVLNLTARGPLEPGKAEVQAVLDGVDLGRETVVRSFEKLMTDAANQHWGLGHATN